MKIKSSALGKAKQAYSLLSNKLFEYFFVVLIPMLIPTLILIALDPADLPTGNLSAEEWTAESSNASTAMAITLLASTIIYLLLPLPIINIVNSQFNRVSLSFFSNYKFSLGKYLKIFTALILYIIVILIGFILLIVPGFIFSLRYSLIVPLILFENKGIKQAFKESAKLMYGRKMTMLWATSLSLTPFYLILLVLAFLAEGSTAIQTEPAVSGFTSLFVLELFVNIFLISTSVIIVYLFYREAIDEDKATKLEEFTE